MARIVPILCPTRDHRGAMAGSMAAMYSVIYGLGRIPLYIQRGAYGYAAARNKLFRDAQEEISKSVGTSIKKARGFLIDDDILIEDSNELMAVVKEADKRECNAVGACLLDMNNGDEQFTNISTYTIQNGERHGQLLTESQVQQRLKPWDKVELAGLGFQYGDICLDYHFHEDSRGEDNNFFIELSDKLDFRLAPIHLAHYKQVLLR